MLKIIEVKKYNPFVIIKATISTRERSSKTKPKVRPKAKIKLEAGVLAPENKKKLDIFYARGFVKTRKKKL